MKKLFTASQMKDMDYEAMHGRYAIHPAVLMENAGRAVVSGCREFLDGWDGKNVVIFSGKGNNGGDGFVIARHLLLEGANVCVYKLGEKIDYSNEAREHLDTLQVLADEMTCFIEDFPKTEENFEKLGERLKETDVIIDALLGTGFHGQLKEPIASIAECINALHSQNQVRVVAVDIPTGVNSDTGSISYNSNSGEVNAIFADITITFGGLKAGFCFYPGKSHCGQIKLDTIGMPLPLITNTDLPGCYLLDSADISELLLPRAANSHKGINGNIAIVAGCSDMIGAALMAAHGSIRSGGGKIYLRVPKQAASYCLGKQPEIMVKGLGTGTNFVGSDAIGLLQESKQFDVIALGPGMGKDSGTKDFLKKIIAETTCPLVLDADALNLLVDEEKFIKKYAQRIIMTPHLGEFSRLSKIPLAEVQKDIIKAARKFVNDLPVTLVLKGSPTIIINPSDLTVYVNPTGNAGMATGGMGDILTGMLASLICHNGIEKLYEAACAGVFLHGAAADKLLENYGPYGFTPLEVADMLPPTISQIEQNSIDN